MSTPHDVTLYPISSVIGLTTEETKDLVLDQIDESRTEYQQNEDAVRLGYAMLTGAIPVIHKLTPVEYIGAPSTAFSITVDGTGFTPASVVSVGGADKVTTYVSPTRLSATTTSPAGSGMADILVKNGTDVSNIIRYSFTVALERTPDDSWLKADIVGWLQEAGVDLTEDALLKLTKAELLELVADLLSPAPPE